MIKRVLWIIERHDCVEQLVRIQPVGDVLTLLWNRIMSANVVRETRAAPPLLYVCNLGACVTREFKGPKFEFKQQMRFHIIPY